jgi:hypothetical protein
MPGWHRSWPVHNWQVTARTGYPFEPKSIARMQAGQFWAVPLPDGRHACGRVLHVPRAGDSLYLNSRTFLAGLMEWSGSQPPTSDAIARRGILAQGRMHIAAIRDAGSLIIGQRDLELDAITGLREVSHRGGGTVWLYEGGLRLRQATAEEASTLPVMSVWGRRSTLTSAGGWLRSVTVPLTSPPQRAGGQKHLH